MSQAQESSDGPARRLATSGARARRNGTVADLIADRYRELTPSSRQVARALTADYPSAGLGTAAALAQTAAVSAPTVTRFAVSLGFADFTELQDALKNELRLRTEGPLSSAEWTPQPGSQAGLLLHRAEIMADAALKSLRQIPDDELDKTISLLADSSRRVFLTGGRYSGILAQHLATNLETVRPRIRYVPDPFGADIGTIVGLGSRDIYVLFDFHRYQRDTLDLAHHVRRKRASTILITDERLSPASAEAKVVLPVNVDAPSPFHSFSAGVMLVELIVVAVVHALGDKAREHAARWDEFRSRELVPKSDQPEGGND